MPEPKRATTIRALDRGLAILEHLSRQNHCSLADLRRATGLNNPSLLRALATLQARGWVHRNIAEGQYELSHSLGDFLGASNRAHPLAELAAPEMLAFQSRPTSWPSDLCAVRKAGQIEIVESTRLRGPMAPNRTSLGIRPSMVLSAHGRSALAFSSQEIAQRHIGQIKLSGRKEDILWIENGKLQEELNATRARGYALREPQFWAEPFDIGPELGALAVPIITPSGLHGSISVLWITSETDLDTLLESGALEQLKTTADRIGKILHAHGIDPPEL